MIPQIQQSPEWYEWRKTKIGASDASVIMGINPWRTSIQLWEEKMGLIEPQKMNERMQRGIDLEPKARECFEKITGTSVIPYVFIHPNHEWMVASLDGISSDKKVAVEIKCNGTKTHKDALQGKIPDYYYCQIQHQLAVTGLDMINYFSFDGEKGVNIEVLKDEKYIQDLIEKEKEFYKGMVEFCPPAQPLKERMDQDWKNISSQWKETISQIKWLEEMEKNLRNQLIDLSGGLNSMGAGIKLSKEVRKGIIDYKCIPELQNMNLEKYRKRPITYWRIVDV